MSKKNVTPPDDLKKTKAFWDDYPKGEGSKTTNWWDSPVIVAECQRRISGTADMNIFQFFKEYFKGYSFETGISICSGSGEFERSVLDNALCRNIDAYEISEKRVREGVAMASKGGYAISFFKEDINEAVFKPDHYDVFFSWSALHHIQNLEGVIVNAKKCLKKNGVLIAQEYIGPDRFQWSKKQLEILNLVFKRIPERLRTDPKTGDVRKEISRPSIAHMKNTDPSEAVRSNDIIPVLHEYFDIKLEKYFGGAIFHPLFNEIMVNFDHRNDTEIALIEIILLLELVLTENKILKNDYAIIIAEPR